MKKVLCSLLLVVICITLSGCGNDQEKCEKSFDCTKIEDNAYRCNYCEDGSKTCSSPKGVTCDKDHK